MTSLRTLSKATRVRIHSEAGVSMKTLYFLQIYNIFFTNIAYFLQIYNIFFTNIAYFLTILFFKKKVF